MARGFAHDQEPVCHAVIILRVFVMGIRRNPTIAPVIYFAMQHMQRCDPTMHCSSRFRETFEEVKL